MAHQAQLQPWIPFFKNTLLKNKPDPRYYSFKRKDGFSTQVTENLFITDAYRDSIFNTITKSDLLKKKEYKYSDLGFILLYDAIEKITGNYFGGTGNAVVPIVYVLEFDTPRQAA